MTINIQNLIDCVTNSNKILPEMTGKPCQDLTAAAFEVNFCHQELEGEAGGEQLPGGQGEQQCHWCHQGPGGA